VPFFGRSVYVAMVFITYLRCLVSKQRIAKNPAIRKVKM
jgi:hypothetical protein